jgi:hypothetical protein
MTKLHSPNGVMQAVMLTIAHGNLLGCQWVKPVASIALMFISREWDGLRVFVIVYRQQGCMRLGAVDDTYSGDMLKA